jgi:hypothetical protein
LALAFEKQINSQDTQPSLEQEIQVAPGSESKAKPRSKMELAQSKAEKYYKQFDFFFNRSCFRTMTEFYKVRFNKFFKIRLAQLKKQNQGLWQRVQKGGGLSNMSKQDMDQFIAEFFRHLFNSDLLLSNTLSPPEQQQVIASLMSIVFSHRFNKGDRFIREAQAAAQAQCSLPIDFSIVRDVMYKYSK